MIAQWAAAQLWSADELSGEDASIDLFTWAFSLDLLGGTGGGGGALAPIADAITSLYENVHRRGVDGRRRSSSPASGGSGRRWCSAATPRPPARSACRSLFVVIALFFVYQPRAHDRRRPASGPTRSRSRSCRAPTAASLDDPDEAKRQVADQLFETLVYSRGWCSSSAGSAHCVDTDQLDDDGFPRPVGPHDPARDVCRDHLKAGRDGHGGYAPRFLRQPPGSDERNAEYDALREGEQPSRRPASSPATRSTRPTRPAVDIQQAGGAFQRLTLVGRGLRRRAGRGRAARLPLAGGDPRPGRRARAARLRAGRAGHRDLPRRRARRSFAAGWPSSPPRSSSRRCTRW